MENDQLTFGIDFDGTLARDPKLFGRFIRMLHRAGHVAVLVTGRSDMTPHAAEVRAVMAGLPEIPLVFAGPNWKRHAAKEAGHEIDIWVDDMPEYIGPQDPEAPMVQIRSAAEAAHTGSIQWAPHRPSEPGDYWVALAPENRKAMGRALGMLPPPVLQVWSLGDGSILSAFWWEDQALEDAWLEGARWMPRETPADPFSMQKPDDCADRSPAATGAQLPWDRYQDAVAQLRQRHDELCDKRAESALYDHEEEMRDYAQVHLSEVLMEEIPGLIDIGAVRLDEDRPCDLLLAEGDIIDEHGQALLTKGECFAVERRARSEGDLKRVKLVWYDEGKYRNEFALAMQPARVVGECVDAELEAALDEAAARFGESSPSSDTVRPNATVQPQISNICPACSNSTDVPEGGAGDELNCTSCGAFLVIEEYTDGTFGLEPADSDEAGDQCAPSPKSPN